MIEVATSTVASSLFSLLNMNGGMPLMFARRTMEEDGFDCTQQAVEEAVAALVNRGLITFESGVLESRYPRDWVMVRRDRESSDGWVGWVMKHTKTGEHKKLTELAAER